MGSKEEYVISRPHPPSSLSKEHIGVWTGWCCKGDREVAREAAAKGIEVKLVVLFLSLRKKLSSEEAESFFKEEVLLWVKELLERKQIFRVSHVLKNIGVNPEKQLLSVFYSTTNKDLRDYIGNHLKKLDALDPNMELLCYLLDLILSNNVLVSKYKLLEDNIECLDNQNMNWKHEVSAILFLRTHDKLLLPYLKADIVWKQLLIYNDTHLLAIWVNVVYSELDKSHDIPENLLEVFKTFHITSEMINQLNVSQTSNSTSHVVLNELSKFGIFCDADIGSFLTILLRIDQSCSIQNIHEILSKPSSILPHHKFLMLLIKYCLKNDFFHVLNTCIKDFDVSNIIEPYSSPHLDLILNFRKLTHNFDEANLCYNIFVVSYFVCDDMTYYFNEHPLILLSLIFFASNLSFLHVLSEKSLVITDVQLFHCVPQLLKHLRIIKTVYSKLDKKEKCNITYYDLLERHLNIDVQNLFAFQISNTDNVPHFNDSDLVKSYGYAKEIDYIFYVKQSRPSIASKLFVINEIKCQGSITAESLKLAQKEIYRLAIKHFTCIETTSSCIAFLEMVGLDSEFLKVALKAVNILLESGQDIECLIKLFMNIYNDPYAILKLLEATLIDRIDFKGFVVASTFIDSIKLYNIAVRFAILYNLKLPELFLKHCAGNNMWLPFLIFAQIKNYPVEQVKVTLQSLKNPNLLEHVNHSVMHDLQIEERNILMRDRNSRSSFLSRIGVHKSVDSLNQSDSVHSCVTSQTSYGSNSSSAGSDFLEIDVLNTKATLLQTLIRCHNSADPPRALLQACQLYRNPLLAILATSYEPDSIVTNWLTWLAVSTELYQMFTSFESIAVCATSVMELLHNSVKNQYPKVLAQSLQIFIPDNPLNHIAEFLNECINLNFDTAYLKLKLEAFKASVAKCRRYSVLPENDHEMTYLHNKAWIEDTALKLLSASIEYNVTSLYNQIQFLQVLLDVEIEKYLSCRDMNNLLDILKCIYLSKCPVKCNFGLYFDRENGRDAVEDCISSLIELELFGTALQIAQIEGLPLDLILINEWQCKYENWDHRDDNFWPDSSAEFNLHNVTPNCVIEFYLNYIDKSRNEFEKYELLKLAYEWAKKYELPIRYSIEKRKWLTYIVLEDQWKMISDAVSDEEQEPFNYTYREMLEKIELITEHSEEISSESLNLLRKLVTEVLSKGHFWLALKLEKMFRCGCADLTMLKLCFSLAEGILMPYQLDTEQRLLLSVATHFRGLSHRRTCLSNRLSSLSSACHSPGNIFYMQLTDGDDGSPVQDTLALLYVLSEKLTIGSEIAYKIFMTYRISLNIEIPYHIIVANTDHMRMLKDVLDDDCMHKLDVVHDFIKVYKWSNEEIADFLCEEIVNAASKYIKSKADEFLMWNLKIDQEFHLVLQLLQENCSLLGYKVYSYASAIHKAQVVANLDFKISELALVIELLIVAHDCFTADCNMEGISIILKKCQAVISYLLTLRSWKLIVRLLTGVARYTEMNYVFQILRENDQFEFLLRKGSRKDNALKVALLEYLKKYCPDNRELYKIVALHFTLFSEVAMLWEREAQSIIRNLIAISKLEMQNNKLNPDNEPFVLFTNTDSTRLCLNKAIEYYTHATEFHIQGEKLAKAMNTAKQAELLALQISLLKGLQASGTAVCILNLVQTQIASLISTQLSFDQSLILVRACNYPADWATVLYEQCILRSNSAYLKAFLLHLSLTDGLVHDISRKFLNANINSTDEIQNMKNILTKLSSVHTKYRIASELGFTDLVEDLISGGQLAYLKDTVWKKGYKG